MSSICIFHCDNSSHSGYVNDYLRGELHQQHNNITFIRSYATQAHGHKPYIQIHNTLLTENNNIQVHVKTNRKKPTSCTDRDTKKKVIIHLTNQSAINQHRSSSTNTMIITERVANTCYQVFNVHNAVAESF